MVKKP